MSDSDSQSTNARPAQSESAADVESADRKATASASEQIPSADLPIGTDALLELIRQFGHDIRGPLGTIISTSDMLTEGIYEPLNTKQARANERVRRNSRRMLAMLDDFVTYLKAEAGQIALTSESFDPRALLASACDEVRPRAEDKGLTLAVSTQESVPTSLTGDSAIIQRVIMALLWNAVAFTPSGSIRVESRCSDAGQWVVSVRDSGKGIAPENTSHIFEPFWRGDERPEVPTAGIGIGLPLSRSLIALMRGQLVLERTGADGSVFTIQLPQNGNAA